MKKVIGYNVKSVFDIEAVSKILRCDHVLIPNLIDSRYTIGVTSLIADSAKELGVLDALFEPVYEEEKKIIEVEYENRGKFLKVEIKNKLASINYNDSLYIFSKEQLTQIIKSDFLGNRGMMISVRPTFITIGCQDQFKNVRVSDIQKVIDAL